MDKFTDDSTAEWSTRASKKIRICKNSVWSASKSFHNNKLNSQRKVSVCLRSQNEQEQISPPPPGEPVQLNRSVPTVTACSLAARLDNNKMEKRV